MDMRLLSDIFDAGSLVELNKAVEAHVVDFGFRYFLFCGCFSADGTDDVYFDNCPSGWAVYYRGLRTRPDGGPSDLHDRQAVTPILWRQLRSRAPALLAEARRFGLVTGSTHPVHGPQGHWSALSFIKDRGDLQAEAEVEAALAWCQLIASYVHEAAARLVRVRAARPCRPSNPLNQRERQVLTCAAAGMTASQIANVLPISRRTVIFHLANARRKLGAANSSHAIGMALSLGLIRARRLEPSEPMGDRPTPAQIARGS